MAVGALGVSMLIIWLLVQYLSYGNRGEEGTRKENVETQDLDKIGIKGKNGLEKADANQNAGKSIRVRILGNSYQEPCHQSIFVTSEQPLLVEAVQNMDYSISEDLEASESETQKNDEATKWQTKVIKSPNSDSFQLEFTASELSAGECLCISTQEKNGVLTMPKLIRAANPPQYKGRLFLYGGGRRNPARKRIAAGAVSSGRGSQ